MKRGRKMKLLNISAEITFDELRNDFFSAVGFVFVDFSAGRLSSWSILNQQVPQPQNWLTDTNGTPSVVDGVSSPG